MKSKFVLSGWKLKCFPFFAFILMAPSIPTEKPINEVEHVAAEVSSVQTVKKDSISLQPIGYTQLKTVSIEKGKLKTVFIDNTELPPDHKKGYNGIAELYHSDQDSSAFVPSFSGFNLEHIFNGESPVPLFEPRLNPMYLYQKNETEVLLYQKPTPVSDTESLIEFKLVAPHYIDFTCHFVVHDEKYLLHDYVGIFFASYMNQPADIKVYFQGVADGQTDPSDEGLIAAYSDEHGVKSTHRSVEDKHDFYFAPDFRVSLANHFSDYRYTKSYFFGRFQNMALAYFFEPSDLVRFSQSPDGAGPGNPAWDFYYSIPQPKTEHIYTFKGRMVYKPFKNAKDIDKEFKKWVKGK